MDGGERERVDDSGEVQLAAWVRVYLHGLLALLALFALMYVVTLLVPLFDFAGSRALAVVLAVAAILVVPPVLGSAIVYGVLPLLGRRAAWRGVTRWDRRLFGELELAKERARVVILDWPGDGVRTMGVLTSTFRDPSGRRELGAVYVPTAPQTRYGYVRIVPLDALETTDWTLEQWRTFQLTFGSISPAELRVD
ncbi:MAG: hypothetical protein AAF957_07280 [Planctomycetota bacterium]